MRDTIEEAKLDRLDKLTGSILARHLEGQAKQQGYQIARLNFKFRGDDWLVIIERDMPGTKLLIAFCNGRSLDTAVRTAYALICQDKLKWREKKQW